MKERIKPLWHLRDRGTYCSIEIVIVFNQVSLVEYVDDWKCVLCFPVSEFPTYFHLTSYKKIPIFLKNVYRNIANNLEESRLVR